MPDLRIIRPRASVRLHLYPGEICEMVCDEQVMAAFNTDELRKLRDTAELELNQRENVQ